MRQVRACAERGSASDWPCEGVGESPEVFVVYVHGKRAVLILPRSLEPPAWLERPAPGDAVNARSSLSCSTIGLRTSC